MSVLRSIDSLGQDANDIERSLCVDDAHDTIEAASPDGLSRIFPKLPEKQDLQVYTAQTTTVIETVLRARYGM